MTSKAYQKGLYSLAVFILRFSFRVKFFLHFRMFSLSRGCFRRGRSITSTFLGSEWLRIPWCNFIRLQHFWSDIKSKVLGMEELLHTKRSVLKNECHQLFNGLWPILCMPWYCNFAAITVHRHWISCIIQTVTGPHTSLDEKLPF